METPPPQISGKEEVLGVSRSGRVRKKSTKLLDFNSDDVERKIKRATSRVNLRASRRTSTANNRKQWDAPKITAEEEEEAEETLRDNSDDELNELVADIVEGVEAESIGNGEIMGESKVRHSLYMTEKANKRKMLKERKDKGKARYTAYSLWAREFRKTSKFSKNQDLDFSNAARRLGELWANVSNREKSAWRRKAKIQATKAKARDKTTAGAVILSNPSISTTNAGFLNRATTSRTRKLAAERDNSPLKIFDNSPELTKRKRHNSYKSQNSSVHSVNANDLTASSVSTSISIEAIDAAAHLKLLGESLTIIGESLKEHDGQIASSGSLSVLLDSLLCSLGPLLCLTLHIPGLNKKAQLKENLSDTLDNIAYVMPGL